MQGLRVVLVNPRNPLNIGAAARAMSNFGFSGLALVQPYEVAFREAVSAVGASAVMQSAEVFASVGEAVAGCRIVVGTTGGDHRELDLPLYRLDAGVRKIRRGRARTALLFGSEKYGLSNDDISHCHWLMRIPARPEHSSMNLGQAVAVCLYEMCRAAVPDEQPVSRLAATEQTEALQTRLDEVLRHCGYYEHTALAGAGRRLRALIKRMRLSERDAVVWLGILRQILWKLKQP